MLIDYKIDENDFLTYQLFIASRSERIQKKRRRSQLSVPLFYIALGMLFYFYDQSSLTVVFSIIGVLWYFLYPIWEKTHYVKHYKAFVKENYKLNKRENATIEFNNDFIFAKNEGSESKILTKEFEVITEIPTLIFIKLKEGQSIILSKQKIIEIDALTIKLKELAVYLDIKYEIVLDWEWK
jgi:hypothetical protein